MFSCHDSTHGKRSTTTDTKPAPMSRKLTKQNLVLETDSIQSNGFAAVKVGILKLWMRIEVGFARL